MAPEELTSLREAYGAVLVEDAIREAQDTKAAGQEKVAEADKVDEPVQEAVQEIEEADKVDEPVQEAGDRRSAEGEHASRAGAGGAEVEAQRPRTMVARGRSQEGQMVAVLEAARSDAALEEENPGPALEATN